jgi:outer membrane protein
MRFVFPLAALALAAQTATAQTPQAPASLTLDEAVSLARRNNPLFQQTINARRMADANVRSAYASLLPSVGANFQGRYQVAGQQFIQGIALQQSADVMQGSYGIGLNYNISSDVLFAPRRFSAARDAAEADVTGAAELLRATVTQQYIAVLQAQARAALQDTLVVTAKGQLELAKARQAVGAGTILDVRTAEVALGRAEVATLQAYNLAEVEMLRLFQQMGVSQPANVTLTTKFAIAPVRFALDSLLQLARARHPDILALQLRERAAGLEVKGAMGRYAPTLSLSTGWGGNASQFTNSDGLITSARSNQSRGFASCMTQDSIRTGAGLPGLSCSSIFPALTPADEAAIRSSNNFNFDRAPKSYSVFVSMPIFNNLQREQQLQQAQINRDNVRFSARARELTLVMEVTQAHRNLETAVKTVELQEINAVAAREQLSFAEERYRVGAATFLDVTTSRGTFEQAQIDRVNAVYEYHRAFAALENAVGRPLR